MPPRRRRDPEQNCRAATDRSAPAPGRETLRRRLNRSRLALKSATAPGERRKAQFKTTSASIFPGCGRRHLAFPEPAGMGSQLRCRPPTELFQPLVELPFQPGLDPLLLEIARPGRAGQRLGRGIEQPLQRTGAIQQPFDCPFLLVAEFAEKSGDGLPMVEEGTAPGCRGRRTRSRNAPAAPGPAS